MRLRGTDSAALTLNGGGDALRILRPVFRHPFFDALAWCLVLLSMTGLPGVAESGEQAGTDGLRVAVTLDLAEPDRCHLGSAIPLRLTIRNYLARPLELPLAMPRPVSLQFTFPKEAEGVTAVRLFDRIDLGGAYHPVIIAAGGAFVSTIFLGRDIEFTRPGRHELSWKVVIPIQDERGNSENLECAGTVSVNVIATDDAAIIASLRQSDEMLTQPVSDLARREAAASILATSSRQVIPYLVRLITEGSVEAVFASCRFCGDQQFAALSSLCLMSLHPEIVGAGLMLCDDCKRAVTDKEILRLLASPAVRITEEALDYLRSLVQPNPDLTRVKALVKAGNIPALVKHQETGVSERAQLLLHAIDPSYPLHLSSPADDELKARALRAITGNGF